jgi:hypothetical protein
MIVAEFRPARCTQSFALMHGGVKNARIPSEDEPGMRKRDSSEFTRSIKNVTYSGNTRQDWRGRGR